MTKPGNKRWGIFTKLVLYTVIPVSLLFAGFAVAAHAVAERELEAELGKRLAAVAASAARQIRNPDHLIGLEPGDEDDVAHRRANRDLQEAAAATGVSRLYLFDREYRSVADSRDGTAIGSSYFQVELDRVELERLFDDGRTKVSVLFEGLDGVLYKAAYAPVVSSRSDEVLLAVGVDAPAEFFARLRSLRRTLLLVGASLLFLMISVAIVFATRLTRPIRVLVSAAEEIGRGNLDQPVEVRTNDELHFLADTMDRMREDLALRDERNQMMLAGIAHEVRNPLGGMKLFAGILADELDEGDERRSHVDRIARELDYLESVVEDFLGYARRPRPEISEVDLADVAAEVVSILGPEANERGVEVELDSTAAPALADEGQIKRAIVNLVKNAIAAAAAADSKKVVVSTGVGDERVFCRIANGGPPIPADVREKMFQPFFTSKEKGTGLGLAFVREIVEDHRGEISCESEESFGTRFTLWLPRQEG